MKKRSMAMDGGTVDTRTGFNHIKTRLSLSRTIRVGLTLVILDPGADGFGGLAIAHLVGGLHSELVVLVLGQVIHGATALGEDLAVGHVKLCAVRPHLLHVVPSDGTASV